jgi:autotransporter-associated beta strand protein
MFKSNRLVKIFGVVALTLATVLELKAQTLIAEYPFNNTLAASVGSFGSAVIGTAGSATLGSSSVCTDNVNNYSDGLRTPNISSLSTTNFQIDFTVNLSSMPTHASAPLFVINGGSRYFGLLLNTTGQLRVLYNNHYQSDVASGITLTSGINYDIQIQYINGVTSLKVNNITYLIVSLPTLSHSTFDRTIFLGDHPAIPATNAAISGCFSNLKVYNNPVAFYPSLMIISSGETGTSGTNWSIVGNELIVTGPASIQAAVIESVLANGDLLIKGSNESIGNITISQAISYTGPTIRNLTFGASTNSGDIDVNANLNVNANITLNSSTTSMLSSATISTYTGTVLTYNITLSSNYQFIDGSITGAGSILKTGINQLVFTSNNNTFSGGTTITGGKVQIGNTSSTGSLGTGNIVLTNSSNTLIFNRSGNYTFDNLISGAGRIQKWGSGVLTLTANNTFSGGTDGVFGGTIQVGNGGTSGAIGSGNFNIDTYSLIFNRSDDFIVNCRLQGSGNITKNGAGKLTLASTSNSHTGLITVNSGTLEFGNGSTGTNFWTSFSAGVTMINLNAGTTLISNFSDNVTIRHQILGAGSFIKNNSNNTTLIQDVNIPTLTINSGSLIANSGIKMTISGVLTNNATLTIQNTATLVQGASSTLAGSGTYNVQQTITGAGSTTPTGRFWYLGSPVATASSSIFFASNAANVAKKRNEVGNTWVALTSGAPENLEIGKGYYTQAMANGTLTFTGGAINNGAITISGLTRTAGQNFDGFNLVSNPYPSYLDWDAVTKTDISTTMWYRSATSNSSGAMVFDTYVAGAGGIGTNLNGTGVSNLIPPMQAFWVRVNSGSTTGSLTMDNSMRAHFTSINGSVAGLKSTSNERDLFLRMNLLQANKKDQLIVYVNETATNGFDQFDGEKMMQAGMPQFYTSAAGKKITINGLNSAKKQQALPITMELPTTGVHSFVIEDLEISNGLVWLEDKQEEIMQALEPGTVYEFYANSGINAERFVLHFQLIDNTTPINVYNEVNGSANFSGKGASVHAEAAGVVVIKLPATTEGITDIQIRDAAGRLVYTGSTNTLETSVQLEQANGIYYVTLNGTSGVEVRKVFIQQ